MHQLPNGSIQLVNLPSSLSLFTRSWQTYIKLFPLLVYCSFLFFIGLLIHASLTSFLTVSVSTGSDAIKSGVAILNTAIGVGLTIYVSFIIAAMIFLIHSYLRGKSPTIKQAFVFAQDRFLSLFYVGLVYLFVMYGGILGIIFSSLFSVWYYFCIYIVLTDEERGIAALAKSHYLVRNLFLRTIGRYIAIFIVMVACAGAIYFSLMVPVIGWLLFILLLIAFFLLAFPYYLVYDFLRFEDISAVERNVEFIQFKGERALIIAFGIAGLLIISANWMYSVLPKEAQKSLQNTINYSVASVSVPLIREMQDNLDTISKFLLKMGIKPVESTLPTLFPDRSQLNAPPIDSYEQFYNDY